MRKSIIAALIVLALSGMWIVADSWVNGVKTGSAGSGGWLKDGSNGPATGDWAMGSFDLTGSGNLVDLTTKQFTNTYYVDKGGSDANGGLSPYDALLTLQAALTKVSALFTGGETNAHIKMGPGDFAENVSIDMVSGTRQLIVEGSNYAVTNLQGATGSATFTATNGGKISVRHMSVTNSGGAATDDGFNGGAQFLLYEGVAVTVTAATANGIDAAAKSHIIAPMAVIAGATTPVNGGITIWATYWHDLNMRNNSITSCDDIAAVTQTLSGSPADNANAVLPRAEGDARWAELSGATFIGLVDVSDLAISGSNITYVPIGGDIEAYVTAATAGDTLMLASGTYTVTNDIDIAKAIAIVGGGCCNTIIQATTDSINVFHITASSVSICDVGFNITASDSHAILCDGTTGTVLTSLKLSDLNIVLNSHAGPQHGICFEEASAELWNIELAIASTDDEASGIYAWNNATAEAATTVHCHQVAVEVAGGSTPVTAFRCEDNGATENMSLLLWNSHGNVTETAACASGGLYNHGGAQALTLAEFCVFNATDYDIFNNGGTVTLMGCVLGSGTTSGTITMDGYVTVEAEAYAAGWNGANEAASKDSVYDEMEKKIGSLAEDTGPQLGGALDTGGNAINDDGGNDMIDIEDDVNLSDNIVTNAANLFLAYPETNLDKVFLLSNDGSGTESSIWNFSASVGHGATRASLRSGSGTNGVWSATAAGTQLEDEYAKGTIANGTTQFGFWREVDQAGAVGAAVPTIVKYHVYDNSGDNLIMTLDGTNDAFVVNASEMIIGEGINGLDYPITIDGQSDDCVITYMEDENDLDFGDTDLVTTGSLTAVTGTFSGDLTGKTTPTLLTDATHVLTAAQCKGHAYYVTNTCDITLPSAQDAATLGCILSIFKDPAATTTTVTVDTGNTNDVQVLYDGTALTAGNATDSAGAAGDQGAWSCYKTGYWKMVGENGTWTDGGAD